jgi:hypothetical protein
MWGLLKVLTFNKGNNQKYIKIVMVTETIYLLFMLALFVLIML